MPKTIKQPIGSKLCGPACVAMICDYDFDTLFTKLSQIYVEHAGKTVFEQMKFDVPYLSRLTEIAGFLAYHDIMLGISALAINADTGGRLCLCDVNEITVMVDMKCPALVGVDSENYPNTLHWVYWDGEFIRDPNPNVSDTRCLSDFCGKIYDWYPIIRLI